MKISILLVEDEKVILYAMKQCIEEADPDFQVFTAVNGSEALALSRVHRPDIVISDIEMPQMNGLSFLQQLKEVNGTSQIYVVSGFQNFAYAKQAIEIGVKRYIVKPFEEDALLSLLQEAKDTVLDRRQTESRSKYRKTLARRSLLQELLFLGEEQLAPELRSALPELLPSGPFLLAQIRICLELPHQSQAALGLRNPILYIEEILNNMYAKHPSGGEFCRLKEGEFLLQLSFPEEIPPLSLTDVLLSDVCKKLGHLGMPAIISRSLPHIGASELPIAWQECLCALAPVYQEKGSVVLAYKISDAMLTWEQARVKFCEALRCRQYDMLEDLSKKFCRGLSSSLLSLDQARTAAEHPLREVLKEQQILQEPPLSAEALLRQCTALYDIERLLKIQSAKLVLQDGYGQTIRLIGEAKRHMAQNIDTASLQNTAEAIGVSPNYLSSAFKRVANEKFIDYLTRLKVDTAKQLLSDRNKKVHLIAQRLGYLDSKHFSRIFKKNVGLTPQEYRALLNGRTQHCADTPNEN